MGCEKIYKAVDAVLMSIVKQRLVRRGTFDFEVGCSSRLTLLLKKKNIMNNKKTFEEEYGGWTEGFEGWN